MSHKSLNTAWNVYNTSKQYVLVCFPTIRIHMSKHPKIQFFILDFFKKKKTMEVIQSTVIIS